MSQEHRSSLTTTTANYSSLRRPEPAPAQLRPLRYRLGVDYPTSERSGLGKCEGSPQAVDQSCRGANSALMLRIPHVPAPGRARQTRRRPGLVPAAFGVALLSLTLAACGSSSPSAAPPQGKRVPGGPTGSYVVASGIHKIKHVIIIEQENRSFDSYFGTYPGADGIPSGVCVPVPAGGCQAPYHDTADVNGGGPHGDSNAEADVNNGAMNGFIAQATNAKKGCTNPNDPACTNSAAPDVMGYHTAAEIPNYWTYAKDFVLQDHMFEPNASWSLPSHLFTLSEWAATCSTTGSARTCGPGARSGLRTSSSSGCRSACDTPSRRFPRLFPAPRNSGRSRSHTSRGARSL